MALSNEQTIGLVILLGALALSTATNNKLDRKTLESLPEAFGVAILSSEDESKKAIQEINQIRKSYGRTPINYSSQVYALALARAKDMNEYGYYDHTNPKTQTCADTMKASYGFDPSDYLAENINTYVAVGGVSSMKLETMSDSIKAWMDSRGHRYNLLYSMHLAGAVACDGNKFVFLGLNKKELGKGCHTGKEGLDYWEKAPPQTGEVLINK